MVIGKLIIEGPFTGIYLPHGGVNHRKSDGIQYYAREPQCTYSWKQSSNGGHVENAIGFTSQQYTFYVGRTTASNSIQIGKVTLELNKMLYGHGGDEIGVTNYEVLVCDKNQVMQNNGNGVNLPAGGSSAAASAASTTNVHVNVNVHNAESASSSSSSFGKR